MCVCVCLSLTKACLSVCQLQGCVSIFTAFLRSCILVSLHSPASVEHAPLSALDSEHSAHRPQPSGMRSSPLTQAVWCWEDQGCTWPVPILPDQLDQLHHGPRGGAGLSNRDTPCNKPCTHTMWCSCVTYTHCTASHTRSSVYLTLLFTHTVRVYLTPPHTMLYIANTVQCISNYTIHTQCGVYLTNAMHTRTHTV